MADHYIKEVLKASNKDAEEYVKASLAALAELGYTLQRSLVKLAIRGFDVPRKEFISFYYLC